MAASSPMPVAARIRPAGPEGALGPAGLPAALGPAPGQQDRLGAGAGGGQGCGAVGAEGPERRDAGDRAQQRRAVPLVD
ncbi:hypothetical protein G6F35_018390 [Rhizopus arrhizus]|nr:hypothetical protein G6F35_018390 [Rhizopus arrhizus]